MKIGELKEKIPTLQNEEREQIRPLCKLLSQFSNATLDEFQAEWDGSRPYEEFVQEQNKLLISCIDMETSGIGAEIRKELGLEPITLDTELP